MYSVDLREKLLALKEKGWRMSAIAREFNLSRTNLYRWLASAAKGELAPKTGGPRFRKLNQEAVLAHVALYPDQTLQEMARVFQVHFASLHYFFKRHRITYKKKSIVRRAR